MSTNTDVIQTLSPDSYQSFLEMVGDGSDAVTHKALVKFHGHDAPVDAYVKVYCRQVAPKGLINEVIGYAIAKKNGLQVPYRAAVLLLNKQQASFLPPNVTPSITTNGEIVAWCVQAIGGPTPLQIYKLQADPKIGYQLIQDDFRKWKELSKVVSLDAWLLNEDRNLGNLVRLGKGRYALIDHGRVCTGNAWTPPLDETRMKHTNKVAGVAWNVLDIDNAPKEQYGAILSSCDSHTTTAENCANDLDYWLSLLTTPQEKDNVTQFINQRVTSVIKHLKAAYGVLI